MKSPIILCYCTLHLLLVTRTHSFTNPHSRRIAQQRTFSKSRGNPSTPSYKSTTATTTSLQLHDVLLASSSVMDSLHAIPQYYLELLRTKPLETKSITAATLATIGDALAQYTSQKSYDPRRGAAFMAFGGLYTGYFQHHWFGFLNSHVVDWGEALKIWGHPAETTIPVSYFMEHNHWWEYFDVTTEIAKIMSTLQDPPTDVELAVAKVAINQFLVVPVLYMPLFFAVTGALGGLDAPKSVARARSLYAPLLKRNYLFWLPMQFFQFFVLPTELQIPFVSAASLVWTIVLSSIGGSTAPKMAPANIVSYEEETPDASKPEEVVMTVVPVNAGVVNKLTDNVRLEDVAEALVPNAVMDAAETVGDALSDPQLGAGAGGFAVGLLASAADGGEIASTVGSMIGDMGLDGGAASVGVAVVTAVGAGLGYLAGGQDESDDEIDDENDDKDDNDDLGTNMRNADHSVTKNGEILAVVMNHDVASNSVDHRDHISKKSGNVTGTTEVEEEQVREPVQ